MIHRIVIAVAALAVPVWGSAQPAASIPSALYRDPPPDRDHPARMEVLHVPSGDVSINAVAYLAAGAGPHPTVIICHGWPGNEKNLDLAQAVRRAGWNAVTFNYRGSWGSPGQFRFVQNPDDARAVLAYLRDPANTAGLGIDPDRMAIVGHSMGGWVAATVGATDRRLLGVVLISAANMGAVGKTERTELIKMAAANAETLAGTSPETMADELRESAEKFDFLAYAQGLAGKSLYVMSSDDGLQAHTDALISAVRSAGGKRVAAYHAATDHGWSGRRIDLQARIIEWLTTLVPKR